MLGIKKEVTLCSNTKIKLGTENKNININIYNPLVFDLSGIKRGLGVIM